MRSKETIFNAALTKQGRNPTQEGQGGRIWTAMDANYDDIVRDAFETGAYPFGWGEATLTGRQTTDVVGFEDAYALSSDVLHITEVYFDKKKASDLLEDWDIIVKSDGEIQLLVNAKSRVIRIRYRVRGQEHRWSAAFALAVQTQLEAVILSSLREPGQAANASQDAEYKFLRAGVKASDNKSPDRMFKRGRLTRAHRSRY